VMDRSAKCRPTGRMVDWMIRIALNDEYRVDL